jgi:hypothetical protein
MISCKIVPSGCIICWWHVRVHKGIAEVKVEKIGFVGSVYSRISGQLGVCSMISGLFNPGAQVRALHNLSRVDGARRLGRGFSMSCSRHVSGMALCVRDLRFVTPAGFIASVSGVFCLDS